MTNSLLDIPAHREMLTEPAYYGPDPSLLGRDTLSRHQQTRQIVLPVAAGGKLAITVEGDPPPWFLPTVERLGGILALTRGWNSYAARPVNPRAVAAALHLMVATMPDSFPPPDVVPTNRGSVQLEWHLPDRDIEVKVLSPSRFYVFSEDRTTGSESEIELNLADGLAPLEDLLAEVARRS